MTFKASDITRRTALLAGVVGTADGRFNWTAGNFTEKADAKNVVKADGTSLSTDAGARQSADGQTFLQAGVGSTTRPVQDKLRETVSVADKAGSFLLQLQAIGRDMAAGGKCLIPAGSWTLSGTFTFAGQRLALVGDVGNVSTIVFTGSGTALSFDSGSGGGQYQSSVESVGFYSPNTSDKTAIRFYNTGNAMVRDVGIATGNWLGANSVGIQTFGREFTRVERCVIACARPIVISRNPEFPTLSADHSSLIDVLLVGTSATHAIIELESGAVSSNLTIDGFAAVGGRDGIRWLDRYAATGAAINMRIANGRFEQGLEPTGWSINLDAGIQGLQDLIVENVRFDSRRNGVKLRKVQKTTFINCFFDCTGKTALDIVLADLAGRVEFINCQANGTFSVTNGRRIAGGVASRAQPFSETWVYADAAVFRAQVCDAPVAAIRANVANNAKLLLVDTSFSGRITATVRNGHSCDFEALGTNNSTVRVTGSDPANAFSDTLTTASKVNVGYSSNDLGYVLENKTGRAIDVAVSLTGSAW